MAVRKDNVHPPRVLRAHRPRLPDAQPAGRPSADVEEEHEVVSEDVLSKQSWLREHLHEISIGMIAMFVLWYLGATYALPFVTRTIFHWNCGSPPGICQYDLNVGHGHGKSHFLTEYWHNEILLIEIVDDDPHKTNIYGAPIAAIGDTDTHIVTLEIAYIGSRACRGKPDIVASISGVGVPVIFYNTGNSFSTEEPDAVAK